MRIDPHVHCRDGNQAYKTTIAQILAIAKAQGVDVIIDMPNTEPPIIGYSDVQQRLLLVPSSGKGKYFLYVGLTADPKQILEATNCCQCFQEVIGLKMFAGRSVGPLAVIEDEKQKEVYKMLVRLGYKGVLAVHCEREADMKPELWNPCQPTSHSLARPKEAEINSVRNQIDFAKEAGFTGTLHICHVSCPETVDLIVQAREIFKGQMEITCGITPHHLLFSTKDQEQSGPMGIFFKVNPPLRQEDDVVALLGRLRGGDINWIETDHAPHSLDEKFLPPYLSGIPSFYFYEHLIKRLSSDMKVPLSLIEAMTCKNIIRAFSPKLDHLAM